jgi:predicted ribosome quality control (RQC) complex YloA/Tae2 family protein
MNEDAIDFYSVKQRKNAYERDARKRASVDVEKLAAEVARLRERIEDLEDAKKLERIELS